MLFAGVIGLIGCGPPTSLTPVFDPVFDELPHALADEDPVLTDLWPAPGTAGTLVLSQPTIKPGRIIKVYLDPGHGAPGNSGNRSATCQWEMQATLSIATDLAEALTNTGRFAVKIGRKSGQRTRYQDRVAQADAWGADVFVSLHTDNRDFDESKLWSPKPGQQCRRSDQMPGVLVIYSDEGPLTSQRRELALSMIKGFEAVGFPLYDGADYPANMYIADKASPSVLLDRRAKGIYVLRRPTMPSVLIELYHSWNLEEQRRWGEARTRRVFEQVMIRSLLEVEDR